MSVLIQRIIVVILNAFLVFILIYINKQKRRNTIQESDEEVVRQKDKGMPLEYLIEYLNENTAITQAGIIREYPCVIGRQKSCDIIVNDQRVSKKHFEILILRDKFRVMRSVRDERTQQPIAIVDGQRKQDTTFDFHETIQIPLASDIILHLSKRNIETKNIY